MQQKFSWVPQLRFYPLVLGALLGLSFGLFEMRGFILVEQIIILSVFLAVFALLLNFISYLVIRDADRAAVLTVVVLLWIYSFGSFAVSANEMLTACHLPCPDEIVYLFPYSLIGLLAVWFCYSEPKIKAISANLSRIVIFLFVVDIVWEACYVVSTERIAKTAMKMNHRIVSQVNLRGDWKPDIYYIILDATGRADTLRNLYGIKDIELLSYLKRQGFYVADESYSNYDRTMLSVSSSLNFNYINYLQDLLPKDTIDPAVPYRMMQQNQLIYCLKKLGYKIVNVSSGFSPTEYNPYADINVSGGCVNDAWVAITYGMTIQRVLEKYNHFLGDLVRAKKVWIFTHMDQVERIKGPKFVFIHIVMPHPPFIFTADGTALPLSPQLETEVYTVEKYRGQAIFVLNQAQKLIESLMKAPNGPPIIVLQGDHGPALNWSYPYPDAYLRQRLSILNAYFLPHCDESCLYSSISPVNTFRVILNQYFHANLPLLPDKSYSAPHQFFSQLKLWVNPEKISATSKL